MQTKTLLISAGHSDAHPGAMGNRVSVKVTNARSTPVTVTAKEVILKVYKSLGLDARPAGSFQMA